jgi:ParB family chromosome partitioning protein
VTKERRLGRGLEALLGRVSGKDEAPRQAPSTIPFPSAARGESAYGDETGNPDESSAHLADEVQLPTDAPAAAEPAAAVGEPGPLRVDVKRIDSNPFQPRQEFDQAELQSLCESLQAHGLLQPVVVRRVGERYQLIAGERRLRAATKAGWTDVPAQVVEADDREMAELAIVENMQRKDLNPLEKAAAFHRYLEQYGGTQEELASRLKLDRSTIANLIRLLELPEPVQNAVRQSKITQGHARALLPLGDEREQVAFCNRIQQEGLSVRDTESLVQDSITQADAEPLAVVGRDGSVSKPKRKQSGQLAALEQEFRAALGTKVKITHNAKGRGKLVIQFSSHEEFERLRDQICGLEADIQSDAG